MTRKLTQAEKVQRELDRWYARNPDDAREHDADDIAQRFQVSHEVARAMYERIQRDAYGARANAR
jgi:hypothetical protein